MAKVLLIDDQEITLKTMSIALNSIGIDQITVALNGLEAMNEVAKANTNFDIIFCDINMPEVDGLSFVRKLATKSIASSIVLMSAEESAILDSAEIIAKKYGLNVLGVEEKPVCVKALIPYINHISETKNDFNSQALYSRTSPLQKQSYKEIRNAIDNDWIIAYFQPQLLIKSNKIVGFEALARINHPQLGLIFPDNFIIEAEANGLIGELTDKIIHQSLHNAQQWLVHNKDLTISINISSSLLEQSDFYQRLDSIRCQYLLKPEQIICELTETMLARDTAALVENLIRLRMHKYRLSIDDFGTGYASLEQLHEIPFHELKIDRCFVKEMDANDKSKKILISSLKLAQDFNMVTVAEGVETESMLSTLKVLGCDIAQGYLISKPVPPEQVPQLLNQYSGD